VISTLPSQYRDREGADGAGSYSSASATLADTRLIHAQLLVCGTSVTEIFFPDYYRYAKRLRKPAVTRTIRSLPVAVPIG